MSHSGRVRSLGKRVGCKPSRVRISPSPQTSFTRRGVEDEKFIPWKGESLHLRRRVLRDEEWKMRSLYPGRVNLSISALIKYRTPSGALYFYWLRIEEEMRRPDFPASRQERRQSREQRTAVLLEKNKECRALHRVLFLPDERCSMMELFIFYCVCICPSISLTEKT
jgi:hypothetical protein